MLTRKSMPKLTSMRTFRFLIVVQWSLLASDARAVNRLHIDTATRPSAPLPVADDALATLEVIDDAPEVPEVGADNASDVPEVTDDNDTLAVPEEEQEVQEVQDVQEGQDHHVSMSQVDIVEQPQVPLRHEDGDETAEDAGAQLAGLESDFRAIKLLPPSEEEGRDVRLSFFGKIIPLPISPMGVVVCVLFVALSTVCAAISGSRSAYFKGSTFVRAMKAACVGVAIGIVFGCLVNSLFLLQARRLRMMKDSTYLELGPDAGGYTLALQQYATSNRIELVNGVGWRHHKSKTASSAAEAFNTRPLLWLHIHKEAGTFACVSAVANGERIVAPSTNCNWKEYDNIWTDKCTCLACNGTGIGGIGAKVPHVPTCQQRADYFARWNFTFGSIERELRDTDMCSEFRYGASLREPLQSIESKVLFELHLVKTTAMHLDINVTRSFHLAWFKELLERVFLSDEKVPVQRAGLPGWKLFDNYKVRAILGEEAFNLGPGEITKQHMDKAVERLQMFDFVKVLDMEASAKDWDGTSAELTWDRRVKHRLNQRKFDRQPKALSFDLETREMLRKINKWDIELYQTFAKQAQLGNKVQRTMARRFYSRLMKKLNKRRLKDERRGTNKTSATKTVANLNNATTEARLAHKFLKKGKKDKQDLQKDMHDTHQQPGKNATQAKARANKK